MAESDGNDDRRRQAAVLPLAKRLRETPARTAEPPGAPLASADPLLETLRRMGDDMLSEPVPDRLIDSLRKKPSWCR